MGFIRIKKWADFQHYRHRSPPWVKLHRALLTSDTWVLSSAETRSLIITLILLAGDFENKIPVKYDFIKRVGFLEKEVDLAPLIDVGFIELFEENPESASSSIESARPSREEKRREEYNNKTIAKNSGSEIFKEAFAIFPKQRKGSREAALRAWNKALVKGADESEILRAVGLYRNSSEVGRGYAQGMARWLNDEGWLKQWSAAPIARSWAPGDL